MLVGTRKLLAPVDHRTRALELSHRLHRLQHERGRTIAKVIHIKYSSRLKLTASWAWSTPYNLGLISTPWRLHSC